MSKQDKSIIKAEEMVLNMGPQHPSTHGVLRLKIHTDGEIWVFLSTSNQVNLPRSLQQLH